ncbi:MAG: peptide chain release factor N(5)-glutamine methyltransferase [Pseudomonadota bacterium]
MADQTPDPKVDERFNAPETEVPADSLEGVLRAATKQLKNAGIPAARGDARILIASSLGLNRTALFVQGERVLTEAEQAAIGPLIDRRAKREPVARILGEREFWGLNFKLSAATLEPRPDSELLVEAILGEIMPRDLAAIRILDLGTGTGCLLLSLLSELPQATGIGLDLASEAVDQASANAADLGMMDRAKFMVSDWDAALPEDERFDVVVSNPPYIPASMIERLTPEVKDYDPHLALDGGEDGLEAYRQLGPVLGRRLAALGIGAIEIGFDQGKSVPACLTEAGLITQTPLSDLAGHPRCVLVKTG